MNAWNRARKPEKNIPSALPSAAGGIPAPEKTPAALLTEAYLGCLFFGLPLVLHRAFLDLMETKQLFFLVTAAVYLLGLAALCLISRVKARTRAGCAAPLPLRIADGCMALFLLAAVAAWLLTGRAPEDIMGVYNRYQGVLTWLLYGLLYLGISRRPGYAKWNAYAALVGCFAVCLLAAANDFYLDPLRAYGEIAAESQRRYASTLGNLNVVSSYLSLAIPALAVWWCMAKGRAEQICTGFGLVCCALGAAGAGSESLALALLITAPLLPLLLRDRRSIRRALWGALLFLLTLAVYGLAEHGYSTRFYTPRFARLLTRPYVLLPAMALCGCGLWLLSRMPAGKARAWRRGYGLCLAGLAGLTVCAVLLCNTVFSEVPLGSLERFLKWGDGWGTDRGRIWSFCIRAFQAGTPAQKLLGGGPGYLYRLDRLHPLFSDAATDTAHNEYLQYLLTGGIVGLAAYLGMLFLLLRQAWRGRGTSPVLAALFLCALGYAAQAAVSIAQPAVTPLFFAVLGLLRGYAGTNAPISPAKNPRGLPSAFEETTPSTACVQ